jgi:uncharacterized protein with PQ loop repeat
MDYKALARDVSGAIMAVSFMLCYLPQILKIIKTESSSDISPTMIFLGLSGYIFGMIYMFLNVFGTWWFLNYLTGIISSLFLLYYWYRHRNGS